MSWPAPVVVIALALAACSSAPGGKPCESLLTDEWQRKLLGAEPGPKDAHLWVSKDKESCSIALWNRKGPDGSRIVSIKASHHSDQEGVDFGLRYDRDFLSRYLQLVDGPTIGDISERYDGTTLGVAEQAALDACKKQYDEEFADYKKAMQAASDKMDKMGPGDMPGSKEEAEKLGRAMGAQVRAQAPTTDCSKLSGGQGHGYLIASGKQVYQIRFWVGIEPSLRQEFDAFLTKKLATK